MKRTILWVLLAGLFLPGNLFADNKPLSKKALLGLSGWVVFDDPGNASLVDFEKHASQIDRAYFDWYVTDAQGMPALRPEVTQTIKYRALAAARQGQCHPWIRVSNLKYLYSNAGASTIPLAKWLFDGDLKKRFIDTLINLAKQDQMEGIQIDFQMDVPTYGLRYRRAFTNFIGDLSDACKKNGFQLGVVVQGMTQFLVDWMSPEQFNLTALGKKVDEMVLVQTQGNRGHGAHDSAGFLDNPIDLEIDTRYMTHVVEPSKVEVIAHANGYDWIGVSGEELSEAQFQALAQKNGVTPDRDTLVSQEMNFDYPGDHEDWFCDGKSAEFVADIAKRYKTTGICVWRFGTEGQDFWDMWQRVVSTKLQTAQVGLSNTRKVAPTVPKIREVFTNKIRGFYFYAYGGDPNDPDAPSDSNIAAISDKGQYWADILLRGDQWSGMGIGICRVNLLPYLAHGALQFYVKGKQGEEHFAVGFSCAAGLSEDEHNSGACAVPVENYVEITTNWKLVTIPLADFPVAGSFWDSILNDTTYAPFKWDSVDEFINTIGPGADAWVRYQIADVRVLPFYEDNGAHKLKNDKMDKYIRTNSSDKK